MTQQIAHEALLLDLALNRTTVKDDSLAKVRLFGWFAGSTKIRKLVRDYRLTPEIRIRRVLGLVTPVVNKMRKDTVKHVTEGVDGGKT